MNSNATVRILTQEWADNLTSVYQEIIDDSGIILIMIFIHFRRRNCWIIGLRSVLAEGYHASELLEPADGFHPSQICKALFADWYWKHLEEDHPDWFGSINPNNSLIQQLFGNQDVY